MNIINILIVLVIKIITIIVLENFLNSDNNNDKPGENDDILDKNFNYVTENNNLSNINNIRAKSI